MSWGYIAAFLDGEGTIQIPLKNGYLRRIEIVFYQTLPGKHALELIKAFLDERDIFSVIYKIRAQEECHAQSWRLSIIRQSDAIDFLTCVLPYLIVKRERAEKALELWQEKEELIKQHGRYFRSKVPLANAKLGTGRGRI